MTTGSSSDMNPKIKELMLLLIAVAVWIFIYTTIR